MAKKDKSHRLSSPSPRTTSISRSSSLLRLLSPTKDRMNAELRSALSLLQLRGFDALEENFLSTDAFLRPWATFRDAFLLMPKGSTPATSETRSIARSDILYYYTLFDEGDKRYDPIADEFSSQYTTNEEKYGTIDKSFWGVNEHEKLLYAWLLQSFKVGKVRNPYGFEYFECRNVCTAWENVFVPIVTAVRKDYCGKGRYHYGRLAKFVEEISPSGLAFPNANVGPMMEHSHLQGVPMLGRPVIGETDPVTNVLVRKKAHKTFWEEEELELRLVYPQYGQVVERPKVKISLERWVQNQRKRADGKQAVGETNGANKSNNLYNELNEFKFGDINDGPRVDNQEAYGPLARQESNYSMGSIQPSPEKKAHKRKSDGMYSSISSANPFSYDAIPLTPSHTNEETTPTQDKVRLATLPVTMRARPLDSLVRRSSGQTTSCLQPLGPNYDTSLEQHRQARANGDKERHDKILTARKPSYEGTGYGNSPSMTSLPTVPESHLPGSHGKARSTRIPSPSNMAGTDSPRKYHPVVEHAIARVDTIPVDSGPPPVVPLKSPNRWHSAKGHVLHSSPQYPKEPSQNPLPRIVSKENIRAALGDISRESSAEHVRDPISPRQESISSAISNGSVSKAFAGLGGRGMNTGEYTPVSHLPTYNTHMFPRVGSPAQGTVHRRRYEPGGQYELEVLKRQIRGSDKAGNENDKGSGDE